MATTGDDERKRLDAVLRELYDHAIVMPLDSATAAAAPHFGRTRGLEPQDALVYASVVARLSSEAESSFTAAQPGTGGGEDPLLSHCFITRDNDFTDEDIRTDLAALGCKILFEFEASLGYVRARLP